MVNVPGLLKKKKSLLRLFSRDLMAYKSIQ